MAKKKKGKWGGPRKNAGRKKNLVRKRKMTVSVPKKYYSPIRQKTKKLAKAYERRCLREL